jgi:alkaline phosphatase
MKQVFINCRNGSRIFIMALLSAILLSMITGCTGKAPKPRNIILMIGDGMGTSHVYAGMVASGGKLNIERCEFVGYQKTYSANRDITDSGASGTAMATGVKTNNGAIGVDTSGNPVPTILELAEKQGLVTGLIATSTITHATPASFAAHNISRGEYEDIAADMAASGVDVLIGGGSYHFMKREDGLNLLDTLAAFGYFVAEQLGDIPADHGGPVAILADTLALPPYARGRGDLLPDATELAVERLSGPGKGFFLMVEGSQIDWAGHANHTEYLLTETLDFDRAVGKAIDFAEQDGETLVIITADHECGGFTILKGGPYDSEVEGAFSTDSHTGVMVPVFTYGPGAELFSGIYENTEIFEKMKALLDL